MAMAIAILARLPIWLDDLVHEHPLWLVVGILALAMGGGIVVWLIISMITAQSRWRCQACDTPKSAHGLSSKDQQTQEAVLSYFEEIEDRRLTAENVAVCSKCRRVFDDHVFRYRQVWANNDTTAGMMYTCKSCGHMMHDPIRGPFVCPICETVHCWARHEESGYVFLTTDLPKEVQDAARGKA